MATGTNMHTRGPNKGPDGFGRTGRAPGSDIFPPAKNLAAQKMIYAHGPPGPGRPLHSTRAGPDTDDVTYVFTRGRRTVHVSVR